MRVVTKVVGVGIFVLIVALLQYGWIYRYATSATKVLFTIGPFANSLIHKSVFDKNPSNVQNGSEHSSNSIDMLNRNVFYNRIEKCGSRSLIALVRNIAASNLFNSEGSTDYSHPHPKNELMLQEMEKIAHLKTPTFYNRHIHYLDFKKHGLKSPIYINMLRDPVDRFVSHYNYIKYGDQKGQIKKSQNNLSDINECILQDESHCHQPYVRFHYIYYFCGFDPVCTESSSKTRMDLAKRHISDNYLLIGMTEDFENTLKLLEIMIPQYFKGAEAAWTKIANFTKSRSKTVIRDVLTVDAFTKLRYHLLVEDYVLYEFAKKIYESLKFKYRID